MIGLGTAQCVKRNRSGVTAHLLLDDRHANTLSPDAQLLHCSSPERISRTKINLLPCLFELIGKLADSCSFANTIHAHNKDYVWIFTFWQIPTIIVQGIVFSKKCSYLITQNHVKF